MSRPPLLRRAARGVSLIEALVALAVMAFGMLAVAGLQATMRLNADIAKQRSEAVRIAQEAIEDWRGFTAMVATADVVDYTDITTLAGSAVTGYTTNTSYTLTRTVTDSTAGLRRKALRVDVAWADRTGAQQGVQLNSMVAAVAPEVAAALSVPSVGTPNRLPRGRHPAIPVVARDFGGGTSGYIPPQPVGGTVVWRFNNFSGLITNICSVALGITNATLVAGDLSSCADTVGQVLSGYVRFATSQVSAPTAATAEAPPSTALNLDITLAATGTGPAAPAFACFDDAPATSSPTQTLVSYICRITIIPPATWSARSEIVPLVFSDLGGSPWPLSASGATNYKVCRYTTLAADTGANPLHPRNYLAVTAKEVMLNQNFLVISSSWSCPTDVAANPAGGDYVNSNTRQHQPAP